MNQVNENEGKRDKQRFKKQRLKARLINHPYKVVFWRCLFLLIFVYLFFLLMKLVDSVLTCLGWSLFALNGGRDTWFSFFGSYFGVIASVVLGIITLRFSIKVEDMNFANMINEVSIKKIRLYDLWRGFKPSAAKSASLSKRFIMRIDLEKFMPYYGVEITEIQWGTLNEQFGVKQYFTLKNCDVQCIRKKEKLCIYIYFDDIKEVSDVSIEASFNYYWMLRCYEPDLMTPSEKQRLIRLKFKLKNRLFHLNEEIKVVTLECRLEYDDVKDGSLKLSEIEHKIEIENLGEK